MHVLAILSIIAFVAGIGMLLFGSSPLVNVGGYLALVNFAIFWAGGAIVEELVKIRKLLESKA